MSKNGHARRADNRTAADKTVSGTPSSGGRPRPRPVELGVLLHIDTVVSSEVFADRKSVAEGDRGRSGKFPFPVFRYFCVGMATNLSTGFSRNY